MTALPAKTGMSTYANSGLPSVHLPALGLTPLGYFGTVRCFMAENVAVHHTDVNLEVEQW